MRRKGLTLIELILAFILISGVIVVVTGSMLFLVNQLKANMQRADMHSQLNYALEDMKMRCVSAVKFVPYFSYNDGAGSTLTSLTFEGECDMYTVTFNSLTDNCKYAYSIDAGTKDLKLTCLPIAGNTGTCPFTSETLVDGKYLPSVTFKYTPSQALNVLKVTLTADSTKATMIPLGADRKVTKIGGFRLWFIEGHGT